MYKRQAIALLVTVVGFAALFATLARWAAVCFALGLGLNLVPWLATGLRHRRWTITPFGLSMALAVVLAVGLMACLLYTSRPHASH